MKSNKLSILRNILRDMGKVMIAFSGGVDSTCLLHIAHQELGPNVTAVTAKSSTFPEREMAQAIAYCQQNGIHHVVIEADELDDPEFCKNPVDRCYLCKKQLFTKLILAAQDLNIPHIAEGSNLDDLDDYRPGRKALEELAIRSPLKEAGLTKEEIRHVSRETGLVTWDKPSFACLSSRIPYGEEITKEKLKMIDQAEKFLLDFGFKQVRVRHHGDIARIEISPDEIHQVFTRQLADSIQQYFSDIGFVYTTLDLKGYRMGSMNAKLTVYGGENAD